MSNLELISSIEAEEVCLGAMLHGDATLNRQIFELLRPNDFYILRNQWVYMAMLGLDMRDEIIDNITVGDELKQMGKYEELGGYAYLTYLINNTPMGFITAAPSYAKSIQRLSFRRKVVSLGTDFAHMAMNENKSTQEMLNEMWESLVALSHENHRSNLISQTQAVTDYFEEVMSGQSRRIPTGLIDLDRKLGGGLHIGGLHVVAGATSAGKSVMMMTFALNGAKKGYSSLIVSLEMPVSEIISRQVAYQVELDTKIQASRQLNEKEQNDFTRAIGELSSLPITYVDKPCTLSELRVMIERLMLKGELHIVVYDYLQLAHAENTPRGMNREQFLSSIARELKEMSMLYNIAIVTGSQLNESGQLRESRGIGHHTDVVMTIEIDDDTESYVGESQSRLRRLRINKQRNGPMGLVDVNFDPKRLVYFNHIDDSKIDLGMF
jgi:replicative DNA helicase